MTFACGDRVRDEFRRRSGGRVTRLRPTNRPSWIDIEWPDGMRSTYGIEAAREFLTVERHDYFGLADLCDR